MRNENMKDEKRKGREDSAEKARRRAGEEESEIVSEE